MGTIEQRTRDDDMTKKEKAELARIDATLDAWEAADKKYGKGHNLKPAAFEDPAPHFDVRAYQRHIYQNGLNR